MYTFINIFIPVQKIVDEILDVGKKSDVKPDLPKDLLSSMIKVKSDNTDFSFDDTSDFFNDSANDLFVECSQSIEDTYSNKSKKALFQNDESMSNETTNISAPGLFSFFSLF